MILHVDAIVPLFLDKVLSYSVFGTFLQLQPEWRSDTILVTVA